MSQDGVPSKLDFFRETLRRVTVEAWGEIVQSQIELARQGDHRAVRWVADQVGMTTAKHMHVTLAAVSGPAAQDGPAIGPVVPPQIPPGTPHNVRHRMLMRAAALAMDGESPRDITAVVEQMAQDSKTTPGTGPVRPVFASKETLAMLQDQAKKDGPSE